MMEDAGAPTVPAPRGGWTRRGFRGAHRPCQRFIARPGSLALSPPALRVPPAWRLSAGGVCPLLTHTFSEPTTIFHPRSPLAHAGFWLHVVPLSRQPRRAITSKCRRPFSVALLSPSGSGRSSPASLRHRARDTDPLGWDGPSRVCLQSSLTADHGLTSWLWSGQPSGERRGSGFQPVTRKCSQ